MSADLNGRMILTFILLMAVLQTSGCLLCQPARPDYSPDYLPPTIYNSTAAGLNISLGDYPRVDGSTSTHPLAILLACQVLNVSYSWNIYNQNDEGGTFERDLFPVYDERKTVEYTYIHSNITHNGTHDAYVNLIDREADLILVARQPSPDELALAKTRGVDLVVKPVALDAFVFLLHRDNGINSLTIDQIRGIYSGNITRWDQVGGRAVGINAYQREDNSGSQELMKSLVMHDQPIVSASDMILYGMMGPINRLNTDRDGIGYSVYFFKEHMSYGRNLKSCAVGGVYPDSASIRSRSYPLVAEVYVAVRTDLEANSSAYRMYDWLLGREGQKLVEESGYVPIASGVSGLQT